MTIASTLTGSIHTLALLDGERVVRIYDSGDPVRDWYGVVAHHLAHSPTDAIEIAQSAYELAQGFTLMRLQMKGKTPKLIPFDGPNSCVPIIVPAGAEWGWPEYLAAVTGNRPSRPRIDDEIRTALPAAGFSGTGRELTRSLRNGYAVEVAQGASNSWTASLLIPRGNRGSKRVTVAVTSVPALLERVRDAERQTDDTQAAQEWQKR